jgi:hypothetical protein
MLLLYTPKTHTSKVHPTTTLKIIAWIKPDFSNLERSLGKPQLTVQWNILFGYGSLIKIGIKAWW